MTLTDSDSSPFAVFDRLRLNLSARSLPERALMVKKLRLERPAVRRASTASDPYNFSDLLSLGASNPPSGKGEDRKPFRFSLNTLTIVGGTVDFHRAAPPTVQKVRDLKIAVPFVGNVSYLAEEYVTSRAAG